MTIYHPSDISGRLRKKRKVVATILIMKWYNSLRFRSRLKRKSVVSTVESPWRKLLKGDENSFLHVVGLDFRAFRQLVEILREGYVERKHTGRRRNYSFQDAVGMYHMYICSNLSLKHLSLIFGVVPSTASEVLIEMIAWVPQKLRKNPDARIRWPDDNEKKALANLVRKRNKFGKGVIGFIDGLALNVQCSSDPEVQSKYYNGYQGDTTVNNVIFFGADGKVKMASINKPGSLLCHDTSTTT